MAYEHESLCKLPTAYDYPGRFGKEGRCFYKLENCIADLCTCIVKPHYFWTRPREKELWLSAQFARWEAAIKPVPNTLRFFDENGNACSVSTNDGSCQGNPIHGLCQVDSKVDSMHGNSTNASNWGKQLAQTKTDYEEALQKLFTTDISATTDQYQYVPIPWYGPPTSNASQTLKTDVKTRFDIHSEEKRCRLAIECRVAQLAIDKGVKSSRDGTLYSEFLAQVQSQPAVWEAVKHTQKGLPQDVFESIQAMFSDEKEDFFESVDFFESIEAIIPVFAGTSFEREGANSPNVITLASGTIREGADKGSSGAKRKYVPVVASSPGNSQMLENDKLPAKYLDDEVDWDAFAAMERDQGWT